MQIVDFIVNLIFIIVVLLSLWDMFNAFLLSLLNEIQHIVYDAITLNLISYNS